MKYIELMKEKLKLEKELQECVTKGDKIVITNKLKKIQEKIDDLEETVSGDIAVAPERIGADSKKSKVLKRPKLDELEESVTFNTFYDLEKTDIFKK